MFRRFLPKKAYLLRLVMLSALAFVLLANTGVWHSGKPSQPSVSKTVPTLSSAQFQRQVVTLTSLLKTKGSQAAFAYTEQEIQTNPSFAKSCHPLMHELGHAAYTYYGGYAQAMQHSNDVCDSGYIHGVLESYFGSGIDIQQALQTACDTTTSVFNQWQCYHGLGHGVMLVSLENIPRSLSLCNTLPNTFAKNACINGVYMQHFVVTSDNGYIPKTNPTSLQDCSSQPAPNKGTCYDYAPSAYLTIYSGQYMSAKQWCSGTKGYVAACYEGIGSQAMKDNITNVNAVKLICTSQDSLFANNCISGAVGMDIYFLGSVSKAESLCRNQFKTYQKVCEGTIGVDRLALAL